MTAEVLHVLHVPRNVVIYQSRCRKREASGLWSVVAPAMRQRRPPKWLHDPHAVRRPAPGLTVFASATFMHGDRPGILRFQGEHVIHVYTAVYIQCCVVKQTAWTVSR